MAKLVPESDQIEYKKAEFKVPEDFWESYSAFANTSGGMIMLGVSEVKKSGQKIEYIPTGYKDFDSYEREIRNKAHDKNFTNKDLIEKVLEVQPNGFEKSVIIVVIKKAVRQDRPVVIKDKKTKSMKAFVRLGSSDIEMTAEEYNSAIRDSQLTADRKPFYDFSISDIDEKTLDLYKSTITNQRFKEHEDNSAMEFLKLLSLINIENKKQSLTATALLFFGKSYAINQTFPALRMDLFDFRNSGDSRWTHRISLTDFENVFQFFIAIYNYLQTTVKNPFILNDDLVRIDTESSIKLALREAVINFIMHADYFSSSPFKINIYDDLYELENPGKMLIPEDKFFTTMESEYRNPTISKLLMIAGYGERAGSGGEQIFKVTKSNIASPVISSQSHTTILKIWNVTFENKVNEDESFTPQEKEVLKILYAGNQLSLKDISQKLDLTRYKTDLILKNLIQRNAVIKTGASRATKYEFNKSTTQKISELRRDVMSL